MGETQIAVKAGIVDELKGKMERASSFVLYNYIGLTVEEVTDLRNRFRAAGVEYKVIKNTMLRRAADELGLGALDEQFNGPTAVAFGYDDPVAPAKILVGFIKEKKKTEIKAGVLDGKILDKEGVKALAELPSKEELIAKVLGSMNAPITGLVMVLSGVMRSFVCALNAVREKKENAA